MNMQRVFGFQSVTLASFAAVAGLVASASAQITVATSTTVFTDISATGTSPGTATDDSEHNVTAAQLTGAGFTGNELLGAVDIRIGNNGAVLWNATTGDVGYTNSTTFTTMTAQGPTSSQFGNGGNQAGVQFVCPLWDDNLPASGQGANTLDWQVIGGNLIIQWTNEDHFNAQGSGTIQYQMIVYGGVTIASGLPLVEYVYNDTLYFSPAYQNDGGSATIGYKNWGVLANANDIEYGIGGGTDSLGDPAHGGTNMQPKVGGWVAAADATLPHAIVIRGDTPPPTVKCAGNTGSAGCTVDIAATDNPSATYLTTCVVTVSNIEGGRNGLIFYGINRPAGFQNTWSATSFLCIKAPTQRTGVWTTTGTVGVCDGGPYSLDFDAHRQTNPTALWNTALVGDTFNFQGWHRETSAKTTGMTDAIEVTLIP